MSSIQDVSDELDSKLNEIRLSKNHPLTKSKVFILLEGKTDIKLFRNIFNHQTTYINEINGKEKVIKALEILQEEGFIKIFGIKDADFDNLEDITYDNINIFITDYADMEIHMIESSAFESLINEFSSENCHNDFLLELKEKIYNEALLIGYLRWYNEKYFKENEEYLINFKRLNFSDFIEVSTCNILLNQDKFLEEIRKQLEISKNDFMYIINDLKCHSTVHTQICNGHDITTLLSYLFNDRQNSDKTNINQKRIEEALRLAYNLDEFRKTSLYDKINSWKEDCCDIEIFKT